MKKVAIVQSNYIPWKGYFDIINMADEFIFYDDCQFTKRDWRNRNKIKTSNGLEWLTIPVEVKGKYHQKIKDTIISDINWPKKHWAKIKYNYAKTESFKDYKSQFEELYLGCTEKYLSDINYRFITAINELLGITTKIKWSMDYDINVNGSTEKLIHIYNQTSANTYLSGPIAKEYMDIELFEKKGISIEWMNYTKYQKYNQLYPPFKHNVSIIDLIFNTGKSAKNYMKSFLS
ncbi:MAG: hypothetical protein CMG57_01895 [Candidatus Marinimicrobia bacterium]|nr:hypothetical protein [Candidatus Neomarinimicrobiota bacterium]